MEDLHYPNLVSCTVVIQEQLDDLGIDPPDTKIPSELTQVLNQPLPDIYDFSIEKELVKRKEQKDSMGDEGKWEIVFVPEDEDDSNHSSSGTSGGGGGSHHQRVSSSSYSGGDHYQRPSFSAASSSSLTSEQNDKLYHLKTVTGSTDAVVLPLLKRYNFQLHEAINAYYRGER